jgi:hypothetical protein
VRRIYYIFRKRRVKNLSRAVPRQGIPFLSVGPRQGGWDLLFLRRDRDSGALWDFFLWWDHDRGGGAGISSSSNGTSSPGRTVTMGPYGTGTYSSSGGTTTVSGYDSDTSSSTTRMRFALGASSSSYITCVSKWSGETGSWQRLDSPNGAMARV